MMALTPAAGLTATFTLNPVDDAIVHSGGKLYNNQYLEASSGYGIIFRSYLKFDLSAIPDNYEISQATLHLFYYSGNLNSRQVNLHHVANDSWTEGGINWINAPAWDNQLYAKTFAAENPPYWRVFDLFGVSGAWDWRTDLTDNAVSLLLKNNDEINFSSTAFRSKETPGGENQPFLKITAEPYPTPLPATILLLGSGLLGLAGWRRFRKS